MVYGPPQKVRLRYVASRRCGGEFGGYLADEDPTTTPPFERLDARTAAKVQRHGYALRYPDGRVDFVWRTKPAG